MAAPSIATAVAHPVPPRLARFEGWGYGLFLHYGLYSTIGRGEWFFNYYQPGWEEYRRQTWEKFTAADFDAPALCRWAKQCGFRYICLTTRHHEGFSLYDTRGLNTWDSLHAPSRRDLVAEFAAAARAEGLGVFFYHTTLDWWEPRFQSDFPAYLAYLRDSVRILLTHYGQVDGLWFDGNWAKRDADWEEDALYGMIRQLQPECMIVNNTSTKNLGGFGHPEIDLLTFEQGRPAANARASAPRYLAMEMCETMNGHWGTASGYDFFYKSPQQIIQTLAACRSAGANLLLNVGPTGTGGIPGYEREALLMVGQWIARHAPMLYAARPAAGLSLPGGDSVWQADGRFYALVHKLPIAGNLHLFGPGESATGWKTLSGPLPPIAAVRWTDNGEALRFTQNRDQQLLAFDATANLYGTMAVVRVAELIPA